MFSEKLNKKIEEIYESRRELVPMLSSGIDEKIASCTSGEQILLHYLYGNMPLCDMVNYPFETFLDYARHGAYLWESGLFRGRVSEEVFCQYIVYHRINTEDISPCRSFFYEKAKTEITGGETMADAVLALNYWCAQEVTYRASDDRTASPMTTYRSAHGRCGEESTFTVSVLRSMGIPARQVYAPRWSHCDDNHAWAEAWCDGAWCFLGACEPEEVLNKGWFLHASSRAMLIHSRWYGNLALVGNAIDKKNIVSTQGMATEINETGTYANTRRVRITVQDFAGEPVKGAQVSMEVLNYSEFFPVAVMCTGTDGTAEIELGLGSLRICGSKGEATCSQMVDVRERSEVTLVLEGKSQNQKPESKPSFQEWESFESFAPQDAVIHSGYVTDMQRKEQKEKLAVRTAIRLKKVGSGNEAEATKFIEGTVQSHGYRKALLDTLTEKDFLDLKAKVLEAHLSHAIQFKEQYPDEIFVPYILAPRIAAEVLTDYRHEIEEILTKGQIAEFATKPEKIWAYIEGHISECPDAEYEALLTFPGACLRYKKGSRKSKELLFVAMCRTVGIPARLNPVDSAMEYYDGSSFIRVIKAEAEEYVQIQTEGTEKFVYFQNWSVTRKYPGGRKLMDLSGVRLEDTDAISLPYGAYEVITANRLPNGNVLGRVKNIIVQPGEAASIELKLEEASLSQMLECVPMPSFEVTCHTQEKAELKDILKGRPNLAVWLSEGQEPTEHILNELCERAAEFNKGKAGIIFLVNSEKSLAQATLSRTMEQLDGIRVLYDCVEERVSTLGRRFYVDPDSIPLILVTDKDANCVYATSGYNVGTADMILKILNAGIL